MWNHPGHAPKGCASHPQRNPGVRRFSRSTCALRLPDYISPSQIGAHVPAIASSDACSKIAAELHAFIDSRRRRANAIHCATLERMKRGTQWNRILLPAIPSPNPPIRSPIHRSPRCPRALSRQAIPLRSRKSRLICPTNQPCQRRRRSSLRAGFAAPATVAYNRPDRRNTPRAVHRKRRGSRVEFALI